MRLKQLQRVFWETVRTEPGPEEQDLVFASSPSMNARDCASIYRRMYWYRQIDALFDVFPTTAEVLGSQRFTELCTTYIAQNPSEHPALEQLGRHLPQFLAAKDRLASGCAAVEWAQLKALTAPDNPRGLTVNDLYESETTHARAAAAMHIVEVERDIAQRFIAIDDASEPAVMLRVARAGFTVRIARVPAFATSAYTRLTKGDLFAAVCAELASTPEGTARASSEIGDWIRYEWVTVLQG